MYYHPKLSFTLRVLCLTVLTSALACAYAKENSAIEALPPQSPDAFEKHVTANGGRVDFVFEDDRPFAKCHASTVVQTANGKLLCSWFGGTHENNPDVSVWISQFDGTTWSTPEKTAKVGQTAHWNPVLFRDADDAVHLFFKVGVDEVNWSTYFIHTRDNGTTWTKPVALVAGDIGGRGPVKNKPIILQDGTWLAPASLEVKKDDVEIWDAFSDSSTDGGKTWTRSHDVEVPDKADPRFGGPGAIQPTYWESEPGKVHSLVRTGAGIVWRSDSNNGGKTWSKYTATDLPNNNSGFDALALEDGRVLLVYNPIGENWGARTPLDLAVSSDNGHTWSTIAHLEDDPNVEGEYSYPAIVRTKDGIAVSYTWRRDRIRCWQIPLSAL